MRLRTALLLVVVVQSLVLAGMIAKRQWTLATGALVVLETRPVDPRSLFQGDYVRIQYAIGQLRLDQLAGDDEFRRHQRIFVVLEPGAPYWTPVSVWRERPTVAPPQVVIRGEVEYASDSLWNPETSEVERRPNVQVRYGIENYFVPEGEGRAIERPRTGDSVSLRIAVDNRGEAAIHALLVNGEEIYRERVF